MAFCLTFITINKITVNPKELHFWVIICNCVNNLSLFHLYSFNLIFKTTCLKTTNFVHNWCFFRVFDIFSILQWFKAVLCVYRLYYSKYDLFSIFLVLWFFNIWWQQFFRSFNSSQLSKLLPSTLQRNQLLHLVT
jgi:hypothetical protein